MWVFLAAGTLYLIGVAVVLVLKPRWMFTPDGNWKEFGIGKREDRYTPFPFWMFCLVWALVSYAVVVLVSPWISTESQELPIEEEELLELPVRNTIRRNANNGNNRGRAKPVELPKGYYVLDRKATSLSGVPKYVYLGAEEPTGGVDSTARSLDSE